jgi:Yippee zinc-binding/DNA-binding /Mis18, centromere assembly
MTYSVIQLYVCYLLWTGLHRVSDLSCKRCKTMVGWFYDKAYEASQKYKEKKFILEKVNLRMEESMNYDLIPLPAGERRDRWKRRSMNWSRDAYHSRSAFLPEHRISDAIFEYQHSKLPSEMSDGDDCE